MERVNLVCSVALTLGPLAQDFLWTLRSDGKGWCLPGGGLEPDEDPATAVLRELKEETGFTGKVVGFLGMYYPIKHKVPWLVHRVKILQGVLTVNEEVSGFHWGWQPPEVIDHELARAHSELAILGERWIKAR